MKYVDNKVVDNFSYIYKMRKKKTRKVFGESFKREKVRLIETGQTTVSQLSKMYDVSVQAIYKWKEKYSKLPSDERVVIEKDSDYKKLLEMEKKVSTMQRLIGKQQILLDYYSGVITQATEHYEEDIEKKFGQE